MPSERHRLALELALHMQKFIERQNADEAADRRVTLAAYGERVKARTTLFSEMVDYMKEHA